MATVISEIVSAVLVSWSLVREADETKLVPALIRFHREETLQILKVGIPAGLQSMAYSVSNTIVQASINGFGTNVMAAYTAYGKLDAFNWMLQNAFGVSITTFVGQNFGAQKYDRVKKSVKVCLAMTAAGTLLLGDF